MFLLLYYWRSWNLGCALCGKSGMQAESWERDRRGRRRSSLLAPKSSNRDARTSSEKESDISSSCEHDYFTNFISLINWILFEPPLTRNEQVFAFLLHYSLNTTTPISLIASSFNNCIVNISIHCSNEYFSYKYSWTSIFMCIWGTLYNTYSILYSFVITINNYFLMNFNL